MLEIEIPGIEGGDSFGFLRYRFPLSFTPDVSEYITPLTPPGTKVGNFTIVAGEVSSLSLVEGLGSDDNEYFQIIPRPIGEPLTSPDFYLLTNDYLIKNQYFIRVRAVDPAGPGSAESYSVEKTYLLKLSDVLLGSSFSDPNDFGSIVASLSSNLVSVENVSELGGLTTHSTVLIDSIETQESLGFLNAAGGITIQGQESFGSLTVSTSCSLSGVSSVEGLGSITINYFLLFEVITWNVDAAVETSFTISWDSGAGILRWYRVEGCCIFPTAQGSGEGLSGPFYPGGCDVTNFESTDSKCVGAAGKQLFVQNILATSVADVCTQLDKYNMKWKVCKMQVYSNPAGPALDSCNRLIDVPFSSLPECIEISLQTDALVAITFEDRVYSCTRVSGNGGLEVTGEVIPTGAFSEPSYSYYGYGEISFDGEAEISSSWDGTLEVEIEFGFEVDYVESILSNKQPSSTLRGSVSLISTSCGNCNQIPSILYSHNNLDKSYILSRFISKNSISFPEYFTMYYSSKIRGWVSNYRISGTGDSGDESWNFVTTWSCLNRKGDETSSPYWKYSILINRSFSTLDFDTRISITFPPEELCRLISNFAIDFSLRLNTVTSYVENSFVDITDYVIVIDKIGVFKDTFWVADPWLDIRLSRSTDSPSFQTIDLSPIIP